LIIDKHITMKKVARQTNHLHLTGSLAQAGVLSRGTLRRILEVHLPSEPYRYPRLPQAAKTLCAISGDRSKVKQSKKYCNETVHE